MLRVAVTSAARHVRGARDPRETPHAFLVGLPGFEPRTSASRTQRATKLRHSPWVEVFHPQA